MQGMTAYINKVVNINNNKINVEINSVNHKYINIEIKSDIQSNYLNYMMEKILKNRLQRGKIYVKLSLTTDEKDVLINEKLLRYYQTLLEKSNTTNKKLFLDLVNMPGVITLVKGSETFDKESINLFIEKIELILDEFIELRIKEADNLKRDLLYVLKKCTEEIIQIENIYKQLIINYETVIKDKISKYIDENKLDKDRLYQEIVYMITKSDINEEIVRFKNNVELVTDTIKNDNGLIGKKINFLGQELLREINTISNKIQDIKITESIVKVKTYIDQLREQCHNIL